MHPKPVKAFNIDTRESFIFKSTLEASEKTGRPVQSIHLIIKGKNKKSGNWFFTRDLDMEDIPVVLPTNFKAPDLVSDRRKELRKQKVTKEEAKKVLQGKPRLKSKELEHLVEKMTVENGKTVLYLKSTRDQWTYD